MFFSEKCNAEENGKEQTENQNRRYDKTNGSLTDLWEEEVKAENSENIDLCEIYRDA